MDLIKSLLGYDDPAPATKGKDEASIGREESGKPQKKEMDSNKGKDNSVITVKTYSPEVTREIENRKALRMQYSQEFVDALCEKIEGLCKSSYYNRDIVNAQVVENSLAEENLQYPQFEKPNPLYGKISGEIEYVMKIVQNGEEECFGQVELAATVMGEDESIFIVDFNINKVETNAPFDVEIKLSDSTDESKQFQWVTWMVEGRSDDRGVTQEPVDVKKYPYICTSVDPSLINNMSDDKDKCMLIRDHIWTMYMGDKNPDYFQKLFEFVPTLRQPKTREEFDSKYSSTVKQIATKPGPMAHAYADEGCIAYIKKTFESYMLMIYIQSTLEAEEVLRRAVEDSIRRSSHSKFRMDGIQAEKILKIANHNIRKFERKDLFLCIRAFDHHLIRKRKTEDRLSAKTTRSLVPQMESPETEAAENSPLYNIRLKYTIRYRRTGTSKLLEQFETEYTSKLS